MSQASLFEADDSKAQPPLQPLTFERPLRLDPVSLTRLAPAVERPGIHLGVWRDGGELSVWGTTRMIPTMCFVLEVIAPGLLVRSEERAIPRQQVPALTGLCVRQGG